MPKQSRARLALALVLGMALSLTACDGDSPPATATTSPPPAHDIADESLPADEYIQLGMPSYDRTWTGQDMTKAAGVLKALADRAPQQLPRFGSKKSDAMFARMVARDNLTFFRSRSFPLAARFLPAIEYIESFNGILKSYLFAKAAGKIADDELVELMGAELHVIWVELDLVDEFLPTISKDDPRYAVRMSGVEKMRNGLAIALSGVLTSLIEPEHYRVATRQKLLAYCRETFPAIVPKLTSASQMEFGRRLSELVDDPRAVELRPQMILLRDEVKAALSADRGL